MTVRAVTTALLAALLACVPGGIERIEYLGPDGRLTLVELPADATEAEVRARLGGPNAIQRSLLAGTVHWLYTYDHSRWNYVLEFRGGRLARVHYQPRPGAAP